LLATRVLTALVLGGAVLSALFLLPYAAGAAAFALLWLGGVWEWGAFARYRGATRIAYLVIVGLVMLGAYYGLTSEGAVAALLGMAAVWWLAALISLFAYQQPIPAPVAAAAGIAVLVPGWLTLTYLMAQPTRGPMLALAVLVVVWAADVGAFFCGRWLGRIKLAPRVSPGKTWEGVAGGVALAALAAWLASRWLALPAGGFVAVAVASALVSVVGDLTVSRFKRNVGLKDSGHWLPGHGGVLDRIDSLTAALPVYALGLKIAQMLA
jgi:phosphatidate cytidylyltransferase